MVLTTVVAGAVGCVCGWRKKAGTCNTREGSDELSGLIACGP